MLRLKDTIYSKFNTTLWIETMHVFYSLITTFIPLFQQIKDPGLLKLLYCEAKKNVLHGKYPVNREDADHLAILQTKIMSLSIQDSATVLPNYDFFV